MSKLQFDRAGVIAVLVQTRGRERPESLVSKLRARPFEDRGSDRFNCLGSSDEPLHSRQSILFPNVSGAEFFMRSNSRRDPPELPNFQSTNLTLKPLVSCQAIHTLHERRYMHFSWPCPKTGAPRPSKSTPVSLSRVRDLTAASSPQISLEDVRLLAPVERPGKYLAIGMNYRKHADEARRLGITVPEKQLWFNGELRQQSNTRELIFNIWQQNTYLTTAFTLEPGDLLATGTPEGSGCWHDTASIHPAGGCGAATAAHTKKYLM
jgi:hypothetical protein